jgi:hypothetical protein
MRRVERMKNRVLGMLLLVGVGCSGGGPKAAPSPPPTRESAQAASDHRQWDECSKQYRALARTFVWQRGANEYSAACCDARGGRPDAAFGMLTRATKDGYHDAAWAAKDPDLDSLHGDARWPGYLDAARVAQAAEEKTLHQDLILDLRARVKVDQDVRNEYLAARRTGTLTPELVEKVEKIDHENTEALKAMVATYGWPGRSLVGENGANDAWLLVQHADKDHAFQRQVLALLEPLVARGEVSPHHFAYLYDRLAVADKRPQRFGTQCDDKGDPGAVEDPPPLDARRAAYGMSTMAEYRKVFLERR